MRPRGTRRFRRLGEVPEDLMSERALRSPLFSPAITDYYSGRTIGPSAMNAGTWQNPYKFSPFTFQSVAVTQERIVPANVRRAYLIIQNRDAAPILVSFGTAPTPLSGFELTGGGVYEFTGGGPGGSFVPVEDVYVLPTAIGQIVIAGEGYYLPPM